MSWFLHEILPWILPPLLGAIIGFITNAIAIGMLFRPYTEKKIFKMRIPFTPGILPRQRYSFAESVGNMVQSQLLTEDALRMQTATPAFNESVHKYVKNFTRDLLELTPASIAEQVSPGKQDRKIQDLLNKFWTQLKKSPIADNLVNDIMVFALELIGSRKISEFGSIGKQLGKNPVAKLLSGDNLKNAVLYYVDTISCNILGSNPYIGDFLSEQKEEKILSTLDIIYPYLLHSLVRWLRHKKTFKELTFRGRIIVKNIINKLNTLQKFIVTAGQYDKTIADKMDEIIRDIINQIENSGNSPENKNNIFSSISSEIKTLREKYLLDLIGDKSLLVQKTIHNFAEYLLDSIIRELNNPKALKPAILKGDETVRELLAAFTDLTWDELMDRLTEGVREGIRNTELIGLSGNIMDIVKNIFESRKHEPVRALLGISENFKDELDQYLCVQVISVINKKVPEILDSINVKDLVVDKINSLDIKNVEKILLSVIQKHLKWINIFGAFLGALIGMIQIISNKLF